MLNVHLLVIDEQFDFSDQPNAALPVPGAYKGAERLAKMISKHKGSIRNITCTLDSHHPFHIAHPIFWEDKKRNNPPPYTPITSDDIKNGTWTPSVTALTDWAMEYTRNLEASGRYSLLVWPPHCLIGRPGSNLITPFANALLEWENAPDLVRYVTKGSNYKTEHYSAVKAEVPDPGDPGTQLNIDLVEACENSDMLICAGEALSHCFKFTMEDITANFGEEIMNKIVFLEDASNPVPGFEQQGVDFINNMTSRGMKISTTDKVFK